MSAWRHWGPMAALGRLGIVAVCLLAPMACGSGEPGSEAAPAPVPSEPTVEESAAIVDEIAASFDSFDFTPVEELLGVGGVWIAISGDRYDRSTVAEFLSGFQSIESLVRTEEGFRAPDGYGFKVIETQTNGVASTFWVFVGRSEDGDLIITERLSATSS